MTGEEYLKNGHNRFTIMAGEENRETKECYTEEYIMKKFDDAYKNCNGQELLHWYNIHEEQYGMADIINYRDI